MSINQAHLIHDHSSGRSSTRLHAPPGGKSSMGSSFGWGDDSATESRNMPKRNPNASSFDGPAPSHEASSARGHNAPGGNSTISFGGPEPSHYHQPQQAQHAAPPSRARKGEFVDNRIGCGVENRAPAPAPVDSRSGGFGDSGASCVKVHQAPGGRSSGNILNWQ